MLTESALVSGRLSGRGIDARVIATGLNHCPGQPAEKVAWFDIALTADAPSKAEDLAALVDTVALCANDWPEVVIHLSIPQANGEAIWMSFTVAQARLARGQKLTGRDFLRALGYDRG